MIEYTKKKTWMNKNMQSFFFILLLIFFSVLWVYFAKLEYLFRFHRYLVNIKNTLGKWHRCLEWIWIEIVFYVLLWTCQEAYSHLIQLHWQNDIRKKKHHPELWIYSEWIKRSLVLCVSERVPSKLRQQQLLQIIDNKLQYSKTHDSANLYTWINFNPQTHSHTKKC